MRALWSIPASACSGLLVSLHALFVTGDGSYRPEKHYMRGPGPKWRAKHSAQ
ncbi:MAG TPA: hypothetical protein VK438_12225 [Xanthobacteraceae bacterium]|nr:hypothetical protein [Xanthobacteraceae bacterium]